MDAREHREPFRHWVLDDWCPPYEDQDAQDVDLLHVPFEARYGNDCEMGKSTCRTMPEGMKSTYWADILSVMRSRATAWNIPLGYSKVFENDLHDDPTLHGGGLHVMDPGGWLNVHLDYDAHPIVPGMRRAVNLIAFLHPEWKEEWGGHLLLCDPSGKVVERVLPKPGRLVAFEVNDMSYHGVGQITGPAKRVSVACYFLNKSTAANTRRRALFITNRYGPPK